MAGESAPGGVAEHSRADTLPVLVLHVSLYGAAAGIEQVETGSNRMNAADTAGVLCVLGLVVVLGGGVVFMLYGVRGIVAMLRGWLDTK